MLHKLKNSNNILPQVIITDCLPHLFRSFRNKYFNKISLKNMLYFHNYLFKFSENAWFVEKYALKNNLQYKTANYLFPHRQLECRFRPRVSCDHVTVIFLFVHVVNCFRPLRRFRARSAIVKKYHIFGVKLVLTNIILSTMCQIYK